MKNNTYITNIHYLYENEISDKTSVKFLNVIPKINNRYEVATIIIIVKYL